MNGFYEEIFEGESVRRTEPGTRHEVICQRLHAQVADCLTDASAVRLLPARAVVQLSAGTIVRPDLAMVTIVGNKLWLVAEIVSSDDHRTDTVTKKTLYEDIKLPRLWMVDPRYDNVEVYRATEYGLALKQILAGREALTEASLPGLSLTMTELFGVG